MVADEQTAGRGRDGRTWQAPPGAAPPLLASASGRTWLAPDRTWQLAAIVSLAMADAAEEVAVLSDRAIRLKWPNDLVVETGGEVRKLGGVLGETIGLGTGDPRAIVGIGLNADWAAAEFPPELAATMTSLREASSGRPIDLRRAPRRVRRPARGTHDRRCAADVSTSPTGPPASSPAAGRSGSTCPAGARSTPGRSASIPAAAAWSSRISRRPAANARSWSARSATFGLPAAV